MLKQESHAPFYSSVHGVSHYPVTCNNLLLGSTEELPNDAGELSVFCRSYFNKTLIGQAGSIGGKARQEVGVEQRDWEYSGSRAPSATPGQTTEEATCKLSH